MYTYIIYEFLFIQGVVKITNDQTLRKIQIIVDQHQKKIAEIVKNSSNSNKVFTLWLNKTKYIYLTVIISYK